VANRDGWRAGLGSQKHEVSQEERMNRKTAIEYLRKNQPHGHHKGLEEAVDVALADMEAMANRTEILEERR